MYPQAQPCGSVFKQLIKLADIKLAEIISKYNSDK